MLSAIVSNKKFLKVLGLIPRIESWRCVRGRFGGATCVACKEVCIKNAVTINTIPFIDESLCEGCGICVKSCPTGAVYLVSPVFEHSFFVKEKIVFLCPKKGGSVDGRVTIPCICSITPDYFFNAFYEGVSEIYLLASECKKCEYGGFLNALEKDVRSANSIFRLLGLGERVFIIDNLSEMKKGKGIERNNVVDYSRRNFLLRLGVESKRLIAEITRYEKNERGLKNYEIPETRKRLIKSLRKISSNATPHNITINNNFYKVDINEGCNLCGNCTSFCPTAALVMRGDTFEKKIFFTPSDCVGCRL